MNKMDKTETEILSDKQLITGILQGDKNLYAVIVRRHNQRLYRVAMSMMNDDAEAEELMQVAYINAYVNLGKFAFNSAFATWLTKILINECLARLKKRRRSIDMDEDMMNNEIYQQQTMDVQTPMAKTLNSELKKLLEDAIRQLPEKYRTVFIMREVEGMDTDETKECLNISEQNVKVRLHRAKTLLKNSLEAYYKNGDILQFHLTRCDRIVDQVMKQIAIL